MEKKKVRETESSGGGGSTSNTEDLGDKFKYLNLREDEQGDVVLEEDLEELEKDAESMALARIHTSRTFSHGAFFGAMRSAWNLAQEVEFRAIKDNLFPVQLYCLVDWEYVMRDGPWLFCNCPMLLASYDGWSELEDTELFHISGMCENHELEGEDAHM